MCNNERGGGGESTNYRQRKICTEWLKKKNVTRIRVNKIKTRNEWSGVRMLRANNKGNKKQMDLLCQATGLGGAALDGFADEGAMNIWSLVLLAVGAALEVVASVDDVLEGNEDLSGVVILELVVGLAVHLDLYIHK